MARFVLELRVADSHEVGRDVASIVQDWILDTDAAKGDFKVPFGYPKTGVVGAAGDLLAEINRAVALCTGPCGELVPGMGQSLCTRQVGHVGDHRCSLADQLREDEEQVKRDGAGPAWAGSGM